MLVATTQRLSFRGRVALLCCWVVGDSLLSSPLVCLRTPPRHSSPSPPSSSPAAGGRRRDLDDGPGVVAVRGKGATDRWWWWSFFGSCVINNCLYVAGGECEGIQRTLQSAEVYDPNRNRWICIPEMNNGMVPFIGVVYDNKWFLKGLDSHRQVTCEVYRPSSNLWSIIDDEMVTGWRNPSISFNGRLYSSDCRDGCKLSVYDANTGTWARFIDSKHHLGNSRAFEATGLVSLNGKLCIIHNNMSITLVDILDPTMGIETDSACMWETVARKGQHKSFVANLWSTIAGRNLKSHIIHCQVLQI